MSFLASFHPYDVKYDESITPSLIALQMAYPCFDTTDFSTSIKEDGKSNKPIAILNRSGDLSGNNPYTSDTTIPSGETQ